MFRNELSAHPTKLYQSIYSQKMNRSIIDFTPLLRPLFEKRAKATRLWQGRQEEVQKEVLIYLLRKARNTLVGTRNDFSKIAESSSPYEAYRNTVVTTEFEQIRPDVMRMINGEKDILWPGKCRNFAQSSGTSGGKSKYIPITDASLRKNHYQGSFDTVAHYIFSNPESRMFSGKGFILGGSFANELNIDNKNVRVGDLSATLINKIPALGGMFRIPDKHTALLSDWEIKLPELTRKASKSYVTNISGVPSWFLTVLKKICSDNNTDLITDIWPGLEVFFHGGISFDPYREEYKRLTGGKCNFRETYNASEGFFAVQNEPDDTSMLLILDAGVFYEFIPLSGNDPVAAWEVKKGETYEMIITSCNGLWRYHLGDTVRIESVDPLKIRIAGRTKSFINAFGEELMEDNAEHGIAAACKATGAIIRNYTAAPLFADKLHKAHHQWLIEWEKEPENPSLFVEHLDKALAEVNSDYEAKRAHSIFLEMPEIIDAPRGLFDHWLAEAGNHKLGGQRKIPRLSNNRHLMETLIKMAREL